MTRTLIKSLAKLLGYCLAFCLGINCLSHKSFSAELDISNPTNLDSSRRPNIILILADDQGWTSMSCSMDKNRPYACSDYHRTPNMDRLASLGMRFSNAYAASPVCSPTRYSLLYGKTPARLHKTLVRGPNLVDHTLSSLPMLLKKIDENYRCAHFGEWHLGLDPSQAGYDESDGKTTNKEGSFHQDGNSWQGKSAIDPKLIDHITNRGIDFMRRQAEAGRPFYLQLSHYAVHNDIVFRESTLNKVNNWTPGQIHNHSGYAAMIADLDESIAKLLKVFDDLDLNKNTYLFFTSDNGAVPIVPPYSSKGNGYKKPTMNLPLQRGKWDLTEGGIRVPFIAVGPNIKANSQCDVPVVTYDMLPTLLDLVGSNKQLPEEIDGGSFAKNLNGDIQAKVIRKLEDAIVFHFPHYNGYGLDQPHSAIRDGDYKLILFLGTGRTRLFNVQTDPSELVDLSRSMPSLEKQMKSKLSNYLKSVKSEEPEQSVTYTEAKNKQARKSIPKSFELKKQTL